MPIKKDMYLFDVFRWLNKSSVNMKALDIYSVVEEAIRSGAQDYLFQINEIRDVNQDNDEENLQNVIKVTQLVRADLQRGLEFYDKLFKEYVSRSEKFSKTQKFIIIIFNTLLPIFIDLSLSHFQLTRLFSIFQSRPMQLYVNLLHLL